MHTMKITAITYYLNISVQAANLSDCRIESSRTFFAQLECSAMHNPDLLYRICYICKYCFVYLTPRRLYRPTNVLPIVL